MCNLLAFHDEQLINRLLLCLCEPEQGLNIVILLPIERLMFSREYLPPLCKLYIRKLHLLGHVVSVMNRKYYLYYYLQVRQGEKHISHVCFGSL